MCFLRDWFSKKKDDPPEPPPAPVIHEAPIGTGGELFNSYHAWFTRISVPSAGNLDQVVTVRFRGFGSDAEKQAAWDRDWRSKYPEWGTVSQVTVSSNPVEIWFDMRDIPNEGMLLPPHIIGHEMIHVNRILRPDLIDPDTFAER